MAKKLTYQEKIQRLAKKQKKRIGLHISILLVALLAFIVGHELFFSPADAEVKTEADSELTTAFVGDLMFGRHVQDVAHEKGYDHLFKQVSPIFEQADYVSGNFENPVVAGDEDDYEKLDKQIHLYSEPEAVQALKENHFTMLNLANNHLMDYGVDGLNDTVNTLNEAEMPHVGAGENVNDAIEIDYQEINGVTIATLGYTDALVEGFSALGYRPGVARAIPQNIFPKIEEADENADLVFVNVHWGAEYDSDPHPDQRELGRAMVDVGADAIIGHHSHVLSEIEQYKDGVIFYGLGNFIFDQGWSKTKDSAIVQYDLKEDGTGQFEVYPVRIRGAQPYVTNNKYYQMKIREQLTKNQPSEDFTTKDGNLVFEMDHSNILEERDKNNEQ
ncbi:MAG TPA: CapA family protein [Pseudogracilibacillus sp.]|nr:CapA family protein [Pseudogracilibacillus sp.]